MNSTHVLVRRAAVPDAVPLAALRRGLWQAMGKASGDEAWVQASADWFAAQLARPASRQDWFAAFVAQVDGHLVSCAALDITPAAPSPLNPGGVQGYLHTVFTEPAYRGRGLASACVDAVLAWARAETDAGRIRLNATSGGRGIYVRLGFEPSSAPSMSLSLIRET